MSVSMVFMCTGTDILEVFTKQDLDGSEVIELAGSGSVYLTELSKKTECLMWLVLWLVLGYGGSRY